MRYLIILLMSFGLTGCWAVESFSNEQEQLAAAEMLAVTQRMGIPNDGSCSANEACNAEMKRIMAKYGYDPREGSGPYTPTVGIYNNQGTRVGTIR